MANFDAESWMALGIYLRQFSRPNELMIETLIRLLKERV